MKPSQLIAILSLLLLFSSCRQEKQPSAPMSTFRAESSAGVTARDLMHQRVGRGVSEIMLVRKGYTTSYNRQLRTPNWVAWTLTRDHAGGSNQRENERFEEDLDVPAPRATYQDYYNSRYDRGHMCPAGDNKWDAEAMTQSFLMTNICPQNHQLNKEDWNDLEMQCRQWARRWGEVVIACGPIYGDAEGQQRYIGRNRVAVPSAFFKVVYRPAPQPLAVGFIFTNNGSSQPWRTRAVSVDSVEALTGFDFFHALNDDVERRVEALATLKGW
jgi:endonuclease G